MLIGDVLGQYRVEAKLGEGGMGEVYRAHDTRLQRDVALKILSKAFARDPDRLARFEREARVLASLNHPNIAQIFGIEESGDTRALVMELVPGRTLDEVIAVSRARDKVAVANVLSMAAQIADALDAAHEAGIIHRDLKPANVKVRDDGVVKVLDFGLAKAAQGEQGGQPLRDSASVDLPTMASPVITQMGSVLGTAAYMSPEQARGAAVDKRSDIWAFGVILFEMLTGRRGFAGDTVSDTIAAVLTRELDFTALPAAVPAAVRELIARCVERDPKLRLRDIGEARRHLVPPVGAGPRSAGRAPIGAAVTIAAVVVLALAWKMLAPAASPAAAAPTGAAGTSLQSIAVLPFVNQSGTPDDEYFSDGMTDELASALMKVAGLRVAARSSAFTFKGRNTDAREVGAKLHVGTVLDGTVRRAGSTLRVTAQLVNASDGLVLWSDRYEREAKDVFKVQDDIAGAIATALRLRLGANASASNQVSRSASGEAHDLYLRGRFLALKQSEDGLRRGLAYFREALDKDPGYAPAYAGMSFAWAWLSDAYLPPREAEEKAKAAAVKALELDPANVEARTMLAINRWFYDYDYPAAEEEFRRALEANPNSIDAHNLRATALCSLPGRSAEGLVDVDRAIALDPLAPWPSWTRELCLTAARRYDAVIAQHQKTLELDPDFFYLDSWAGAAYRETGRLAESAAEYERARAISDGPLAGQAITYIRMGRTAEARAILQEFMQRSTTRYVSPDQIGLIHAHLGEIDQAMIWMEKAYDARSAFLVTGFGMASYDPLRRDPRFIALTARIKTAK